MKEALGFIVFIILLVLVLTFILQEDPSGVSAPSIPEGCMDFGDNELVSFSTTGQYGQNYEYICRNESGQYLFCQPEFEGCR